MNEQLSKKTFVYFGKKMPRATVVSYKNRIFEIRIKKKL